MILECYSVTDYQYLNFSLACVSDGLGNDLEMAGHSVVTNGERLDVCIHAQFQ